MRTINYSITAAESGWTVEKFLKSKGISQRVIVALKKLPEGMLQNGVHTRTIDVLREGDLLQVNLPQQEKRIPLCEAHVPILYEDEDVIVYNKPWGMPCHQSGGHIYGTLDGVYAAHCVRTSGCAAPFRPINRLDKDTTGAVVAARNQLAAGKLWKSVEKRYIAITTGIPSPTEGKIDLPIRREIPMEMRRIVAPDGQRAVTCYRVLESGEGHSLVGFRLLTGRTHQIRVHMAYMGWPLAGDELYGQPSPRIGRQALHCGWVSFPHPITGKRIEVTAPFPEDMAKAAEAWEIPWQEPDWRRLLELGAEENGQQAQGGSPGTPMA